jgi:o-succinylbenzoate---CoA ligase
VPHLVAIDLPGGDGFVDALRRAWDDGDAAFPVDRRLPNTARRRLIDEFASGRLIDADGVHNLSGRGVEPGDALVVATSGTTGDPRGVVLTHSAVLASALATSTRLGVTADDTWLACLPLSHVGGLSVVTRAMLTDTALVVHDGFDATAAAGAAGRGATLVSLVPTALRRIDASVFRRILLGGAAPPAALPDNVVTTYGMTETGSGIVYDGHPLDGVEIRIDDCSEIHVRGPMLLRGYRNGETPLDRDGWLPTGDLGTITPGGLLQVHGRRSDLIITGGENVWPAAVEAVLIGRSDVADAAIIGVDDPEWGQRVVALIVANGSDAAPDLATLRAVVAAELPAYMAPKELRLVSTIPRTASGKVRRHSPGEFNG